MAKDLTDLLQEGLNKIKLSDFLEVTIYKVDGFTSVEVRDHSASVGDAKVEPYNEKVVDFPHYLFPFTTNDISYETRIGKEYTEVKMSRFLPLGERLKTLETVKVEH